MDFVHNRLHVLVSGNQKSNVARNRRVLRRRHIHILFRTYPTNFAKIYFCAHISPLPLQALNNLGVYFPDPAQKRTICFYLCPPLRMEDDSMALLLRGKNGVIPNVGYPKSLEKSI